MLQQLRRHELLITAQANVYNVFNFLPFIYYHNGDSLCEVNEGIAESCMERQSTGVSSSFFCILSFYIPHGWCHDFVAILDEHECTKQL